MAVACTTLSCPHCDFEFSSTGGIFGQDARLLRDAHVPGCPDNPRNRCFCGAVFPNGAARDKHAMTCESNPANRFKCFYCPQDFVTSFGMMGRVAVDGKALRDNHAIGCKDNPANTCFCGNLFPNPEARNAHAVTCDKNPANIYECQFCKVRFVKAFNMFGFCSVDGRAERDAHQLGCEKNPKNICFCGAVFPNPTARDKHTASCPSNPANRHQCSFCERLFVTRYGLMGRVAYDGKAQREAHEVGCEKNPANVCFCGQLFLSASARDAHAVKCEMNPANRHSCPYCRKTFVTTYGLFSSNGGVERDAHMAICMKNPVNAACEYCNMTFIDAKGPMKWIQSEAHQRCKRHSADCEHNPRNRFSCERCGKCFVSGQSWLGRKDARYARDEHQKVCTYIPCDYQLKEADVGDWMLMSTDLLSLEMSSDREGQIDEAEWSIDTKLEESQSSDRTSGTFGVDEGSLVCGVCQDLGDSASTCFHDAHSSNGDDLSECGDVSSTQDVAEESEQICMEADITRSETAPLVEQDGEDNSSDAELPDDDADSVSSTNIPIMIQDLPCAATLAVPAAQCKEEAAEVAALLAEPHAGSPRVLGGYTRPTCHEPKQHSPRTNECSLPEHCTDEPMQHSGVQEHVSPSYVSDASECASPREDYLAESVEDMAELS